MDLSEQQKPDWPQIIKDLQAVGLSYKRLSYLLNVAPGTVAGWVGGSQPRYEHGRMLLKLHSENCAASQAI